MIYEKEIPAYALQVAKAPKIISCPAVYHTEKVMSAGGHQTVTYQFEEDILVPDTKEDMEQILLMEGTCDITPTERKVIPKTDDLLNFTGTLTIQTLYRPENKDCLPVSITSKVPFQYQWHLHCIASAEGIFQCKVKSLEHMIINERKFRVKVVLEFIGQLFLEEELSLFQGLDQESLETRIKKISLCCREAVKKEELQIDGWVEGTDSKVIPVSLLQQHFNIVENYRQVTSEKIVLNGFIFADFLYCGENEDGEEGLYHQRGRIEFTQFVPLEKKHRGKKWSLVKASFRNLGLTAVLNKNENDVPAFHVEGKVETYIALYAAREQEMVVDAYHQTKQFSCSYKKQIRKDLICTSATEISFREMVPLPEGCKAEDVVCGRCRPVSWECEPEKGRIRLSAKVESACLWRGEDGYHMTKASHKLQQTIEMEGMEPGMEVVLDFLPKESRLTLLNDRQIELSCSLQISCDGSREKEILLLEDPAFIECDCEKQSAMVITAVEDSEDLWTLAKRYRTTEAQIRKINHLEGELIAGQKILIIK